MFFPFGGPVGWTAAALAYTGIAAPNGVGKAYWLRGTSISPIARHLMPDVLKGMIDAMSCRLDKESLCEYCGSFLSVPL